MKFIGTLGICLKRWCCPRFDVREIFRLGSFISKVFWSRKRANHHHKLQASSSRQQTTKTQTLFHFRSINNPCVFRIRFLLFMSRDHKIDFWSRFDYTIVHHAMFVSLPLDLLWNFVSGNSSWLRMNQKTTEIFPSSLFPLTWKKLSLEKW